MLESYGYNHRGERVLCTSAAGDAQITVYDDAVQWIGNHSETGQLQQQLIWLDNYPVSLISAPITWDFASNIRLVVGYLASLDSPKRPGQHMQLIHIIQFTVVGLQAQSAGIEFMRISQ